MKYFKRAGIYKASNVSFDPKLIEARSYDWWVFVKVIKGKVVFNSFRYSNTTSRHQSKVRSLMRELGIKVDLEVSTRLSLNSHEAGRDILIGLYHNETFDSIPVVEQVFSAKLKRKEIDEIYVQKEEALCTDYLFRALKYQEVKAKKFKIKLENYLENEACFRDYHIYSAERFGAINSVAVHQVVDEDSMEGDVENALHNFHRDGFGQICFYINGL